MRLQRQRWLGFSLTGLVLIMDQLSKAWAVQTLEPGVTRPWLPRLLDLQLVYNRGAAFSLLTGATGVLAVISAAVAVALAIWLWRQRQLPPLQVLAAGLLLGGTLGNGLDRWRLGAVVDFLALVPIDFPVFNLADVSINLAVICLGLSLLRGEQPHEP
ncbi:MAG: signal peptidase II [Cyanobacteria bacterium K_DeepCast_35m_m2_023]|nr:signal peptidase II [Cyanobacteria bacterium K_DeepCast_35m_m2_023]